MGLLVGWTVLIPRTLREEFDRAYPGRGAKKILTITAIRHALEVRPQVLKDLYKDSGIMANEFSTKKENLKEIAQSLLEARRLGRSLESIADALIPLASDDATRSKLQTISDSGRACAVASQSIYNQIAQEALS
ncbi:MAG TPA: hypothetical protein VIY48_22035 [Candidatus Paceibacterota bacterium]